MVKKKQPTYTNDEIRKKILQFLDQKRKKARSLKSIQVTITEIKKGLKEHGLTQSETVTNLDYLVQNEWVKEEVDKKTFTTPKGFNISSNTPRYRLSDVGVKYVEEDSEFDRSNVFGGINITNIGGVTVVGSNNVVRNEYIDIFRALEQLENEVKLTEKISDNDKLSAVSDIRTIKNQFSKLKPSKDILKTAFSAISFLGSVDGLIGLYQKVEQYIGNLM